MFLLFCTWYKNGYKKSGTPNGYELILIQAVSAFVALKANATKFSSLWVDVYFACLLKYIVSYFIIDSFLCLLRSTIINNSAILMAGVINTLLFDNGFLYTLGGCNHIVGVPIPT